MLERIEQIGKPFKTFSLAFRFVLLFLSLICGINRIRINKYNKLVIEKLLKGLYAKNNEENPYTIKSHNLLALAEKCNLELTDKQVEKLQIITQFNISARYDDYKETFNQKCTDKYTSEQIKNIEEVRTWLKTLLTQE